MIDLEMGWRQAAEVAAGLGIAAVVLEAVGKPRQAVGKPPQAVAEPRQAVTEPRQAVEKPPQAAMPVS